MKIYYFLFVLTVNLAFAQDKDSVKVQNPLTASFNLNINNNGISLFPNLSFGKTAVILNLTVGKKGLFFEPELRWGLNGKPWSYIYDANHRRKAFERSKNYA